MDYEIMFLQEKLSHMNTFKDAGNYLTRVGELQQQVAELIAEKIQKELDIKQSHLTTNNETFNKEV